MIFNLDQHEHNISINLHSKMPDIEAHGAKSQKHQEIGDNMNKRTRPRQSLPAKQIEDKNNSESEDSSDCFDDTHDSGVIDYNPDQVPNETSKY